MYFFYLDESGCSGSKLDDTREPIFVLGGVVVNDKKWNEANKLFVSAVERFFENDTPEDFELHAMDIFTKNGKGYFSNSEWEKRNNLLINILNILEEKSIKVIYTGIDKKKLLVLDTSRMNKIKTYFDNKIPYLLGYDYLISCIEEYTKVKLSKSSRSMIILDQKKEYQSKIDKITNQRRYIVPNNQKVKWIVEFSTPVDSKKNTFVQMSDLVIYIIRKYLEIENGYRDSASLVQKNGYREFYKIIHDKLVYKSVYNENIRSLVDHQSILESVLVFPSSRWKSKRY